MARDVDLSSKQWLDIVFEGKNKDYGAYEMRATSTSRHNKATLIVFVGLAVILALLILSITGVLNFGEDEGADSSTEQESVEMYDANAEEEIEEPEIIEIEEQQPEEIEQVEEQIEQIQNTAIDIVEDDKVVNEVKTQDELKNDDRQMGSQDVDDGISDRTKEVITTEVIAEKPVEKPKEDNIIYTTANVQQQPSFPGGDAALYKWLGDHIQYPAAAAEEGVSGRVVVEFVISKTGSIENVRVVRGRHPALDKEAIRVVKAMPAWTPGRNNGQPVKVTYNLPVTFKLQQ